eukprot:2847342-Pyramimonas_sp.AAC.1
MSAVVQVSGGVGAFWRPCWTGANPGLIQPVSVETGSFAVDSARGYHAGDAPAQRAQHRREYSAAKLPAPNPCAQAAESE